MEYLEILENSLGKERLAAWRGKKAVVMLSGGLDSALNLALSLKLNTETTAIYVKYGCRAGEMELRAARFLANHYCVELEVIDLAWLEKWSGGSALFSSPSSIEGSSVKSGNGWPDEEEAASDQMPGEEEAKLEKIAKDAVSAWIPNRNGLFMNIGAAKCDASGSDLLLSGFNLEEAGAFPDNSLNFLDSLTASFAFSTRNSAKAGSYTINMEKKEIASLGKAIDLPLSLLWSCYEGGAEQCGRCLSCRRFEAAINNRRLEQCL